MTPSLLRTYINIAEKPGITKRDTLTIARRMLRTVCQSQKVIYAERHALRRQARKLRQFLPFTALAIANLEQQAGNHCALELDGIRPVLIAYGQAIIHDRDGIAAALGFEGMCDLLNINPVHRAQAQRDGDATLQGLAYIARLEDSATDYGEQWGAGGPLFEACHAATIEFIRTCPEHLLPDPFAPGEVFGPKLPPELRVV